MRRISFFASITALTLAASIAGAQVSDSTTVPLRSAMDSAFARARNLVIAGQTQEGRQIADSILAATPPGTGAYGDALYGHAMLAATSIDAERDYQRIIVEYPLSAHAGDALLQLAQLERSQGKRSEAVHHLQRYLNENGTSPRRAQAGFWLAQLLFEQNKDLDACSALRDAGSALDPGDVELRNQMDFYTGRCAMATARAADSTARADSLKQVAVQDSIKRASEHMRTRAKAHTAQPTTAAHVAEHADSGPYSVQVGAYDLKAAADTAVAALKHRSIDARVDGTRKPFRVRIGRYATRAAAAQALTKLKTEGISGFVTRTDGR